MVSLTVGGKGGGYSYRVPGGQGVGLEGPMGSSGRPRGSHGFKGKASWVPGVQGVGLQGPMGSRG